MIRVKLSPASENLAKSGEGCKMFHVEHELDVESETEARIVPCGVTRTNLFHVERRYTRSWLDFKPFTWFAMQTSLRLSGAKEPGDGFPQGGGSVSEEVLAECTVPRGTFRSGTSPKFVSHLEVQ
jgi:hypothetical protein